TRSSRAPRESTTRIDWAGLASEPLSGSWDRTRFFGIRSSLRASHLLVHLQPSVVRDANRLGQRLSDELGDGNRPAHDRLLKGQPGSAEEHGEQQKGIQSAEKYASHGQNVA